ncbi:MAG: maleylacetoacetate isomerase [Polyangiaceae bacterium]
MAADFTLYSFHTSSASHRVRIALHLKGIVHDYIPVNITKQGTEEWESYRHKNPQALVPALHHEGHLLTQSMAILEYLEEVAPSPALLPKTPVERARVRSIAMYIVSEIQPMQNLRVQRHLFTAHGKTEAEGMEWRRHWVALGMDALERQINDGSAGLFCHGDAPTIADCCLIPQIDAARRWGLDVNRWPTIARIGEHASSMEAFRKAAPAEQPDAPKKS